MLGSIRDAATVSGSVPGALRPRHSLEDHLYHLRRRALAALAAVVTAGTLAFGGAAAAVPYVDGAWTSDGPGYAYLIEGDEVHYSSPHGVFTVGGVARAAHQGVGGGTGVLGYPTAEPHPEGPAYAYQTFERGVIYASPHGAFPVQGGIWAAHRAAGGGSGGLGYPSGPQVREGPGYGYQTFERGILYAGPRGAFPVAGEIQAVHGSQGGGAGSLGYPTDTARTQAPGYGYQTFERGVVYASPRGAYAVTGAARLVHEGVGGGRGVLGYPTSAPTSWGQQSFERGVVTSSGSSATFTRDLRGRPGLFVYGTLKAPNHSNYGRIAEFVREYREDTLTDQAMYLITKPTLRFPVARNQSGAQVNGQAMYLDSARYDAALARADAVEGYRATAHASSYYQRVLRTTRSREQVWVYIENPAMRNGSLPALGDTWYVWQE